MRQHGTVRYGQALERSHPWAFNLVGGALMGAFAAILFRNPWSLVVFPAIWAPGRVAMLRKRGIVS